MLAAYPGHGPDAGAWRAASGPRAGLCPPLHSSVYHNKPGSLEGLRLSVEQYVREVTADTVER